MQETGDGARAPATQFRASAERAILHEREPMWKKLARCYPPQLELLALALLVLALYLALSAYPTLPDTIPMHFDSAGIPDGWGSKNTVFIFPALSAFMYALFTFTNFWFAVTQDPRKLMSLPPRWKAALTDKQTEELRIFLNRCLFALKVLIQGLAAYGTYIAVEIALGRASRLGTPWFFFTAATLVLAGFMVWKSYRMTRTSHHL